MDDVIEVSPSGRAKCRGCKSTIEKGDVRFGEVYDSDFGSEGKAIRYWHLLCAAERYGARMRPLLEGFSGTIPNRAEVDKAIASAGKKVGKGAKAPYPYAEISPNARARCMLCGDVVDKATIRVVVERESETPTGMLVRGPGYLHPLCAIPFAEDSEEYSADTDHFVDRVLENSLLDDDQREILSTALT